ncbi:MAG: DNA repair protein RadC [Chloroflexi bacterium]|nr:DNA repair protein RadC [Chloroflexota bacterium]
MKNIVEYSILIRDMPLSERPRERLKEYGADKLSNAELLAIILRTGTNAESVLSLSQQLLARQRGLAGLARAGFSDLCSQRGLGEAKVCQLKAALELGKRLLATHPDERPTVKSPADLAKLLMLEMGYLDQEHLRVVLLNTKNQVVGISEVYKGNVNTSLIRVGELFKEAVRQNCPAIIMVHNHPSGDPTPSEDDIQVTMQAVEAGKTLDIEVLDHLVIGEQRWVSLKEKRLGFQ